MTNPHTQQLSELIITDCNKKVNYVFVIFDHSLVFQRGAAYIQCDLLNMNICGSKHVEECYVI